MDLGQQFSLLPFLPLLACAYLDHLNEGNTEVEVGQVAADKTKTEEDTDRDNSAQVNATGHFNRLAAIEEVGVTSHQLSSDGRKGQVVGGQNDRITWRRLGSTLILYVCRC